MSRPLIIDTFMFNGNPDGPELDLLECRLEEMTPAVDFVVAVEADVDHQDHPKPYWLTEHLSRYDAWSDKLIVVRATGLPTAKDDPDPWARELAQREYVMDGLREIDSRTSLSPTDIVLHGDADEICRSLFVRNVRCPKGLVSFEQRLYAFAVDWLHPDPWGGTVAGQLQDVMALGANPFQKMRNTRNSNRDILADAGWHFSWLGGRDAAMKKLGSFCHPEIHLRTQVGLEDDRYLREGLHVDGRKMAPVDVDATWPAYIYERRCPPEWFRPR